MSFYSYEGDIGFIYVDLIPIENDGTLIDDEKYDELIDSPEDLVTNNIGCSVKIVLTEVVLYDISNLKGKDFQIRYNIMTSEGVETFVT